MKRGTKMIIVIIASILVMGGTGGAGRAGYQGSGALGIRGAGPMTLAAQFPYQELSESERAWLLKMREEEKLARDVYLALYQRWNIRTFQNIAGAEQRHMDAVKSLLDKYGLADPVMDHPQGFFPDPIYTDLYTRLVAQGIGSPEAALIVGAQIEDLDIYDIGVLLSQSDNEDIHAVFQNLVRGSRNHLRAFMRMLNRYGGAYSAQHITQEEMNKILSTPWE